MIIFYHVLSPHKVSDEEIERLLFDQIVQQEIIELHKLKMHVESKGGIITYLKTDAITRTFPGEKCPINLIDDKYINVFYWDDEKTIAKYKLEPVGKHVKYPKMEKYMRKEKYALESQEWNITPDVEDRLAAPAERRGGFGTCGPGAGHYPTSTPDSRTTR